MVENFAKNLRRYREINDLTQEEVARITGAQTSHISRLESGYRSVGLDDLEEFCDALGVDPLLMLTEDPEDTMILAGKRIRKWLT